MGCHILVLWVCVAAKEKRLQRRKVWSWPFGLIYGGFSSVGRALPCEGSCHEFDPRKSPFSSICSKTFDLLLVLLITSTFSTSYSVFLESSPTLRYPPGGHGTEEKFRIKHKKSMSAWCNGSHETLKMFCLIASQFESECGYKFCWTYGILRRSLPLRSNLRINEIYLRQKYPPLP